MKELSLKKKISNTNLRKNNSNTGMQFMKPKKKDNQTSQLEALGRRSSPNLFKVSGINEYDYQPDKSK